MVVHTAAGSHTIPLLPQAEAEELRERIAGLARTDDEDERAADAPPSCRCWTMAEPRRLHPSAVVIYSADALRNAAFPLLVIVAMTLLGGAFDGRGLLRAAVYGGDRPGDRGARRRDPLPDDDATRIGAEAIHHHTGLLRKKDTDVPLDRIEAIDVHQGPLQRAFGVFAVDVQTGAGEKGGEISLPALTPDAVEELRARAAAGGGRASSRAPDRAVAPHRRARAGDRGADRRAARDRAAGAGGALGQVLAAARRRRARRGGGAAGSRTR